jgi:hypothetical protein
MTNRFGVDLHPKEVRWAAAEGVTEDVIAAVLLLHERSVEEIVPQLSPLELEKVIELVGRSLPLPARNLRSTRPAQKFDGVRTDAPERPAERGGQGRDQAIRQRSPVPERFQNWPRRPAEPNRARETCRATFDTSGNTPGNCSALSISAIRESDRHPGTPLVLRFQVDHGFVHFGRRRVGRGRGSAGLPNTDSTYNRGRQH